MSNQPENDLLIVSENQAEMRLDKILASYFPTYSRTYFQYLIEQGSVLVNGKPTKKREKPHTGDEIEICFLLTPEISLAPENIPLDIIYEDEHLLAINKPAGMVVHPAPGHYTQTFVHALLFHCQQLKATSDNLRPGIVHRLDKDTSGLLLAAKTQEAHQKLVELFATRQIEKHYLALCLGNPGDGVIKAPLQRHPIHRTKMTVVEEGGKEAISHCQVLSNQGDLALVDVRIITGRTHQIRVHLKHKGAPVLGDPLYGSIAANLKYGLTRQMLHAHRLSFIHPFSGENLSLIAPLPDDMNTFLLKYKFMTTSAL